MTKKIGFNSCYRVESVAPDMVFLLSEKKPILLRGRLYFVLAPLLQESLYDEDQILDSLSSEHSIIDLNYALGRLKKNGYVVEANDLISQDMALFFHSIDVPEEVALERIRNTKVYVKALCSIDTLAFEAVLKPLGIQTVATIDEADLSVVLASDYLAKELGPFNLQALEENRSWLLIRPFGEDFWVGPLFKPKQTGCWKCLVSRLRKNHLEEAYIQIQNQLETLPMAPLCGLSSIRAMAYNFAAMQILKYVVEQRNDLLLGKVITFNSLSAKTAEHFLTKRPQCECCGQLLKTSPIKLSSLRKSTFQDGGVRSISAIETFEKYSHLISPITGVVTALTREEVLEGSSIHCYSAGHNFAISNPYKGLFNKNLRSKSMGKGRSDIQAKTSALCEAIERYSGIFEGNEYRKKSSYKEMTEKAILPKECLLFSEKQYALRDTSNRLAHSFHLVAEPFCENTVTDWTPAWSLTNQKQKFILTSFCYYAHPEPRYARGDSNGNASGNFFEEAVLHALFELIERDAVAIWWYNRLQRPAVDLKSFEDSFFDQLCLNYLSLGREIWVLDVTCDLQIPTFVALSKKITGLSEEIIFGFGCDLNAQVAISRALTEMNQFLTSLASNPTEKQTFSEESQEGRDSRILQDWIRHATVENQPYLKGSDVLCRKSAKDYGAVPTSDFLEDILFCQKKIEEAGMEVLVVDQTKPDIDLKVVKVIVPGLRHFWPRFAPGRLYEVPVKMGWTATATKEEDLNPIGMFI